MKNIRRTILAAGMLSLLFVLIGCGNRQTDEKEKTGRETAFIFTDDLGREVRVEHSERVVTLIGSFTDIWLLAGGKVTASVNDSWESMELPLGEEVIDLGNILEPDIEKLIASEPDFVIASANIDAHIEMEEILSQAGIEVAYFAVSDFDEYLHMLRICTQITEREDLYAQNGLKVQEQIAEIKERVDGRAPVVLFLRASATNVKAKGSGDSVCGEMLSDLGCINIADSNERLLDELSMEAIIAADPDYIFVTIQGNNQDAAMQNVEELLISNPAWGSLTAVKEKNYYLLDKHLYYLKPNARWGEAYAGLADILYPEE